MIYEDKASYDSTPPCSHVRLSKVSFIFILYRLNLSASWLSDGIHKTQNFSKFSQVSFTRKSQGDLAMSDCLDRKTSQMSVDRKDSQKSGLSSSCMVNSVASWLFRISSANCNGRLQILSVFLKQKTSCTFNSLIEEILKSEPATKFQSLLCQMNGGLTFENFCQQIATDDWIECVYVWLFE